MNDREKWRERVRDIRATSTTWWWWYYFLDWLGQLHGQCQYPYLQYHKIHIGFCRSLSIALFIYSSRGLCSWCSEVCIEFGQWAVWMCSPGFCCFLWCSYIFFQLSQWELVVFVWAVLAFWETSILVCLWQFLVDGFDINVSFVFIYFFIFKGSG